MSHRQESIEYIGDDQVKNTLNISYAENSDAAVIFLLPALGVKAKFYDGFCRALSEKNIHLVSTDLRGNGNSSIRPNKAVDFGYKDILNSDIPAAMAKLRTLFPNNKVYFMGHSLGGQILSLFAASSSFKIDGIIFIASGSVHYKGWSGISKYKTLLGTQFIGAVAQALGYFPGKKLGFGGTEAKTLMKEWSSHARTGIYSVINAKEDYEKALKLFETNILAINIEGDNLCPNQATTNLIAKFSPNSKIERHLLSGAEHKLNHFNWTKYYGEIVPIISKFVAS